MAYWQHIDQFKMIRCDTLVGEERKEVLGGYGAGRMYDTLRCSSCHKLTMVDSTIKIDYCPHCGERMTGNYPTWVEWLVDIGVFPQKMSTIPSVAFNTIRDSLSVEIPADIAEKIGLKPKEAR